MEKPQQGNEKSFPHGWICWNPIQITGFYLEHNSQTVFTVLLPKRFRFQSGANFLKKRAIITSPQAKAGNLVCQPHFLQYSWVNRASFPFEYLITSFSDYFQRTLPPLNTWVVLTNRKCSLQKPEKCPPAIHPIFKTQLAFALTNFRNCSPT